MKCLTLKIQCKNEVSITKMRMLCWMGGKTRRDKIRKDTIWESCGNEKMVWACREDLYILSYNTKNRSYEESRIKRPGKTIWEIVRKSFEVSELDPNMI